MTRDEANRLLHRPAPSAAAIRAAFYKAVRAAHPDTGGDGSSIAKLKEARDLLMRTAEPDDYFSCKLCGGRGRVGIGFGTPCPVCRGTGEA